MFAYPSTRTTETQLCDRRIAGPLSEFAAARPAPSSRRDDSLAPCGVRHERHRVMPRGISRYLRIVRDVVPFTFEESAQERTRTSTLLKALPPQGSASANSATCASARVDHFIPSYKLGQPPRLTYTRRVYGGNRTHFRGRRRLGLPKERADTSGRATR